MNHGKDNKSIGILFILFGLLWICKAIGLFEFNIFFAGWWTLFIIVPCCLGLIRGKSRGSNLVGLILGLLLLFWRQGAIPWSYVPGIFVAMIFILLGISIMMGKPKEQEYENGNQEYQEKEPFYDNGYSYENTQQNHWQSQQESQEKDSSTNSQEQYHTFETCPPNISAFLVGKSVSCLDGIFQGTNIQSILGNVQLDLRQAQLERDVYVKVNLILGGVDIYLPDHVRVVCNTQGILGDVRDVKSQVRNSSPDVPAIHIVGTCILGGLELK